MWIVTFIFHNRPVNREYRRMVSEDRKTNFLDFLVRRVEEEGTDVR